MSFPDVLLNVPKMNICETYLSYDGLGRLQSDIAEQLVTFVYTV